MAAPIIKPPYIVIKPDGRVDEKDIFLFVWHRFGATVTTNGFVVSILRRLAIEYKLHFLLIQSRLPIRFTDKQIAELEQQYPNFLIPTLGGQDLPKRYFQVPPDDTIAQYGIDYFLKQHSQSYTLPYNQRIDKLIWRGHCSSEARRQFISFCNHPKCDVSVSQEKLEIDDFISCRYLPIINGVTAPGNAMWILGSGSTPICVNNPDCWWLSKTMPWIHYIPVDLASTTPEELMDVCSFKGKEIATNAKLLARRLLTTSQQIAYTMSNIVKAANKAQLNAGNLWVPL